MSVNESKSKGNLLPLSIATLGVVYGDIGTSPLYALRECFSGEHALPATEANVYGVLSLILWALILVISVKYLAFIARADNRGEGGVLALMALTGPSRAKSARGSSMIIGLGLFGAALLYGDGVITPAISVLSAVEGLHIATPAFADLLLPLTVFILVALFLVQRHGTARVGAVFGPLTLMWFLVIGILGLASILDGPQILLAANPAHGLTLFLTNGWTAFYVLSGVFLVVTGGEALYADMGHFGLRPIRITWFALVLPALVLNYFGQGALLLRDPSVAHNPFYLLAPSWGLYPLVALATFATIIASQAVISGCFSLTRQAIQLGYCPRLEISHTSDEAIGQIYIGPVNWALMVATIGVVLGFRSSSALAAAYGVAVSTTMVVTTVLFAVLARRRWGWDWPKLGLLLAVLIPIDVAFFAANIVKIQDGAWFPIVTAMSVFICMTTWKTGRGLLANRLYDRLLPVELFLRDIEASQPPRVAGTAVFMTGNATGVPPALLHNFKHNRVLHNQVVFLTILTEEVPYVDRQERVEVTPLGNGFFRMVAHYGFMEAPDVRRILAQAKSRGLALDVMNTSFFLGRETLLASRQPGMARWRKYLFALMSRNAQQATSFFHIPPNRVVELGAQIEL
jgi:KUP system potassium uptake protein